MKTPTLAPSSRLLAVLLAGLALCLAAVFYLLGQPALGLNLKADHAAGVLTAQHALPAGGPAVLESLAGPSAQAPIALSATDLIEEPDLLPTYAEQAAFMQKQSMLSRVLAQARQANQPVLLQLRTADGQANQLSVVPGSRSLGDLPFTFWMLWAAALGGLLLGTWVWTLRPQELGTRAFAVTGLAMFLFTASASVYGSRELALDGGVIRWLSIVNHGGVQMFAAAMIVLFLVHPQQLVRKRWLAAVAALFFAIWVLDSLRWLPETSWGNAYPTIFGTLGIMACALWQWRRARHHPLARAAIRWMGLVTALACSFFCLAMLPSWLSGAGAGMDQAWALVFFTLIYAGLAVGVGRYRLFQLDQWAYRILLYAVATLALIALDAFLVYALHLGAMQSLALALIAVGFLYLPVRNFVWSRMVTRTRLEEQEIFRGILDVVLAATPPERTRRWQQLLEDLFQPLEVVRAPRPALADETASPARAVAVEEDGLCLRIPDTTPANELRLRYPWKGRGIYGQPHAQQARQLLELLRYAEESRNAFAQGVSHERHRIARDLHDDIGASLLTGLHQSDIHTVHGTLRDAMRDIRSIVTGLTGQAETLADLMAALRYESSERLDAADLALAWHAPDMPEILVTYPQVKNLRACLREALSNIIRHARASHVDVRVSVAPETGLAIAIRDDGQGLAGGRERPPGNGLGNLRQRMEELGGGATIHSNEDHGVTVTLTLPFHQEKNRHDALCPPTQTNPRTASTS